MPLSQSPTLFLLGSAVLNNGEVNPDAIILYSTLIHRKAKGHLLAREWSSFTSRKVIFYKP